jgi:hypothetical protein
MSALAGKADIDLERAKFEKLRADMSVATLESRSFGAFAPIARRL